MDLFFFENAPEAYIISDYDGKIIHSNIKMKQYLGETVDSGCFLFNLRFKNAAEKKIFSKPLDTNYFEFDFENREISVTKPDGFTLHFLLSAKKIEYQSKRALLLSFKNVTDFVGYKNIFEDLYNNLSTKTIELDRVIKEKELAFKMLQKKEEEMERQLLLARDIQNSLLPHLNLKHKNYELASRLQAASLVSGDFFSIWMPEDHYINLIVADVTGHGVPSAFITMLLKMSLQTSIKQYKTPEQIVKKLNNDMYQILSNAAIFVTLLFVQIDMVSGKVKVINCGHPVPIIVRENGEIEWPEINGLMLGVIEELDYGKKELIINKNDTIYFLSDGILEAQNKNNEFFEDKFLEIIKTKRDLKPEAIIENIFFDIQKFIENNQYQDDCTIICIKKKH
ncbi:MAG: serine/threonine-protein phosphatase [Spirochaetes bacterium]|nr:serine/threonine-protein phosphatase [Spirochaetota bacterium]